MAKSSTVEISMQEKIKEALSGAIKSDFHVEIADDSTTSYQHFVVISDFFKKLGQVERQEFVWKILREKMPADELLKLTMILTFTQDEAEKLLTT